MANVLIIDQDSHLTDLLNSYLSMQGFKVSVVRKGEDGLHHALKNRPDLIIMDALMPDATGFQMCNRFRQNEATHAIPIIMMSSLARFPNQQRYAMERGANEFVAKPLKMFELGELVDKYVRPNGAKMPPVNPSNIGKPVVNMESSPTLPTSSKTTYTLSTEIHRHLSSWLGKALTREKEDNH
jgi:DNA-binding response OmpR family regulator